MFNSGLKESSEEKVELIDVDSTAFKLVLDYLYSGALGYRHEDVCKLDKPSKTIEQKWYDHLHLYGAFLLFHRTL